MLTFSIRKMIWFTALQCLYCRCHLDMLTLLKRTALDSAVYFYLYENEDISDSWTVVVETLLTACYVNETKFWTYLFVFWNKLENKYIKAVKNIMIQSLERLWSLSSEIYFSFFNYPTDCSFRKSRNVIVGWLIWGKSVQYLADE